ncbi:hypothetical protein F4680DRAFT_444568 [Xylaria scruposa]|nr:hypothetical protein F4680DRAFT_444568 [Xylaria scruposa]
MPTLTVATAVQAVDLMIEEYGVYLTAIFLKKRISKVHQFSNPYFYLQTLNSPWFVYNVVYRLARGLEVHGIRDDLQCPTGFHHSRYAVNWPAMGAIAVALDANITPGMVFKAAVAPQKERPTKYEDRIIPSPFAVRYDISIEEARRRQKDLPLDDVIIKAIFWFLENDTEISQLKRNSVNLCNALSFCPIPSLKDVIVDSQPPVDEHECNSNCEEWICSRGTRLDVNDGATRALLDANEEKSHISTNPKRNLLGDLNCLGSKVEMTLVKLNEMVNQQNEMVNDLQDVREQLKTIVKEIENNGDG